MEARRFQCEECGTRFTIPAETLEKFPSWRPRRCRACRGQTRPEVHADKARPARQTPDSSAPRPASSAASAAIYAEGSCESNPGDGGWAAVKVADGRIVREASGFEPSTTNNRMELTALVEGLKMTAPDEDAVIWTASEFCFKAATVWAAVWSRNGWRKADDKPIANVDLIRQMHALLQRRPRVRVEWRRGGGDPWSGCASATARARRSRSVPPPARGLAGVARA